ncbi:hypothetical protein EES39_19125 [Streptomyces sp. ADI92-24]|nr:hypothetical protein EES39_19125 [Streptomyces sp. ADI92-24]
MRRDPGQDVHRYGARHRSRGSPAAIRPDQQWETSPARLQQGLPAHPRPEQFRTGVRGSGCRFQVSLGQHPPQHRHGAGPAGGGLHVDAHGAGACGCRDQAVGMAHADAGTGAVPERGAAVRVLPALGAELDEIVGVRGEAGEARGAQAQQETRRHHVVAAGRHPYPGQPPALPGGEHVRVQLRVGQDLRRGGHRGHHVVVARRRAAAQRRTLIRTPPRRLPRRRAGPGSAAVCGRGYGSRRW